jgi:hypothetical protein
METKDLLQRQILTIAGEAVSLVPTGFPKGEEAIVAFDQYYLPPGVSPSDSLLLKSTMRDLFSPGKKDVFDKESGKELETRISATFLPPCNEFQKQLVLRSLQFRFDLLRKKLNTLGIRSFQDLRRRIKEMEKIYWW